MIHRSIFRLQLVRRGMQKTNTQHTQQTQFRNEYIKGYTHYLRDKQDFDVSNKGPSSGICRLSANSRQKDFTRNVEILFIA